MMRPPINCLFTQAKITKVGTTGNSNVINVHFVYARTISIEAAMLYGHDGLPPHPKLNCDTINNNILCVHNIMYFNDVMISYVPQ